ncbi:MAG: hypothetical protein JKY37_13590 [Nannocystaceae bacterium]|nr:hypothetical protein [Nannocystaceae bacterium]
MPTTKEFHAQLAAFSQTWFNGAPGLVLYEHDQAVSAFQVDVQRGQVVGIAVLRNPEKLAAFQRSPPRLGAAQ